MVKTRQFILLACLIVLSACAANVINYTVYAPFCLDKKIAIVPFTNNTETPLAGERAMSITAGILRSRGIQRLVAYIPPARKNEILPGMTRVDSQKELIKWAESIHARYVITGQVNEWTYKVGLDGEPVVGLSIQMFDLQQHRVVWSAVGSQSGNSRVAVSTVAQNLVNKLVVGLFKR